MTLSVSSFWRGALVGLWLVLLSACGSSPKPTPAPLGEVKSTQPLNLAWTFKFSSGNQLHQTLPLVNDKLAVAASDGKVAVISVNEGWAHWQRQVGTGLSTGAGFDGENLAVVTTQSELVMLKDGNEIWLKRLVAQSYTNPLVAGGRVFVLLANRAVSAFDATDGQALWTQQRPGEPLVLKQNGVLIAHQNTLLAGMGGHLVALNPDNGQILWDVTMANPRGVNDLERLVVASLSSPVVGFSVIYGMSDNPVVWWDNASAKHVGYQPQDSSAKFKQATEARQLTLDLNDPAVIYQGGGFVKNSPI